MQGLPGRPGEKGSPGEPVSTENSRAQPVLSEPLIVINDCTQTMQYVSGLSLNK